ncbi:hypothetical protein [Pseudomonas syringae group genomosp. 3]|uniref:hypothetical protein n=1 Tax=Pseudomonas syringae group genomosp. 3 TaxID=251701 RepID=UPI0013520DE4|nr:hypothetical protein [Pseudomonas syringae group genomosp. 3]
MAILFYFYCTEAIRAGAENANPGKDQNSIKAVGQTESDLSVASQYFPANRRPQKKAA